MTRAFGSPKTPRTVGCGRKPGNAYASHSRRFASLESPSKHHARFPARLNRSKPSAGADFQLRSAQKLSTLPSRRAFFFKWIKPNRQNLRIKHFYGTSENAVKTQIWIAVCVYVLAAIIRRELMLKISLYTFLQILSVHSFEKIELSWAFQDVDDDNSSQAIANQLNLFES